MRSNSRLRGVAALAVVTAMTLVGTFGNGPTANAATVHVKAGSEPTIMITVAPTPSDVDADGNPNFKPAAQSYPQLGKILLAQPGSWVDATTGQDLTSTTTFTYAWSYIDSGGTWHPETRTQDNNGSYNSMDARDYVPVVHDIGYRIGVTVTPCNNGTWSRTGTGSGSSPYVYHCSGDLGTSATAQTSQSVVGINKNLNIQQTGTSYNSFYVTNYNGSGGPITPGSNNAWITFYGYPDNTPPSNDTSQSWTPTTFPNQQLNRGIHAGGDGDGSYANPITLATDATNELPYGTEIYVERFHKYFIAEDDCYECGSDWNGMNGGSYPQDYWPDPTLLAPGDDGGPGMIHFDLWIGGPAGDWPDTILCEDALTWSNDDGTPYDDPIIVNPPKGLPTDTTPIFNPTTSECQYYDVDPTVGATEDDPLMIMPLENGSDVGLYQSSMNIPSGAAGTPANDGFCIADPGNDTAVGQQVQLVPCDATDAAQNLTFAGMSMMLNNLCIDDNDPTQAVAFNGSGRTTHTVAGVSGTDYTLTAGSGASANKVYWRRCDLNPGQQWELGYDGTISDIQTSSFYLADLGPNSAGTATYLWAVRAGGQPRAADYWDYPFMHAGRSGVATVSDVTLSSDKSSVDFTVSGLTTPTFKVYLVPASDVETPSGNMDETQYTIELDSITSDGILLTNPMTGNNIFTVDGFSLDAATPSNGLGTFSGTATLPSGLAKGTYAVAVLGITGDDPDAVIPPVTSDVWATAAGPSTAITSNSQIFPNKVNNAQLPDTSNFRQINRSEIVFGASPTVITIKSPSTPKPCIPTANHPCTDTGGSVVSSTPIFIGTGLLALGLAAWFIRRRGLFIANK